jgi:hypothetical protein
MAEYKQPIVSDEYLFKWEPEKKILFFITQGAHITGEAMKQLDNFNPQLVEKLKAYVVSNKPTIGTVIDIKDHTNCLFIVSRKHFSSKHDLDLVRSALASLGDSTYKIAREDFPTIISVVATEFPNIELKSPVWSDKFIVGYETRTWEPPSVADLSIGLLSEDVL